MNCCRRNGTIKFIGAIVLCIIAFSSIPITVNADKLTLTLDEAIGLGLKNSTVIKTKLLALYSAKAQLQAAKAAYYPTVSASTSWTHLFDQPKTPDMTVDLGMGSPVTIPGSYAAASDPVTIAATINQSIYTFGKIKDSVEMAEKSVKLAEMNLEEEKRALIVKVRKAFYGYILAKKVLRVMAETAAHKKDAYDIATKRFNAGLLPDYEVLSAESDLESFRPQVISAQNQVQYALLAVMDLLGIEDTGNFDVELVGSLKPNYYSLNKQRLIAAALAHKYEIRQYKENIKIMELQEKLAHTANRPVIGAFVHYQLTSGFDTTTGKNKYWGGDSWNSDLTCGASVQMPLSALFPWSKENANLKKTQLDLESMKTGLSSIESGIRLAVENLVLKLQEEQSKIASNEKAVELAQKLYESSSERYTKGLVSRMEFKDAQIRLNNTRLAYLRSIFNYKLAVFDLMDAVGVDHF